MSERHVGGSEVTEVTSGHSRRWFLKLTATGALGFFARDVFGGVQQVYAVPIPGGTLLPGSVPKFVTRLVVPPPMPSVAPNVYSIAMRQFSQAILPAGQPATTVWSYGAANQLGSLNYPAFTIEAVRGTPTTVTWINGLVNGAGAFLPHLLPVDPTLHWANPPGGTAGRDSRPTFLTTPGPYTGPVPIVTHVHGMSDVADHSDGYAEAWYLPAAVNIPAGFATADRTRRNAWDQELQLCGFLLARRHLELRRSHGRGAGCACGRV